MVRYANGDNEAQARLVRNNREYEVENRALAGNIAGQVGEFVPPVWLMGELARVARPGRVVADQINGQPLNMKTNTIEIPRLTGGTEVAQQSAENVAVQDTDATSDVISAKVTMAGQQVVSVQLIDQSPVSMDQIILEDLAADLAKQVDLFVLNANATGTVGLLHLAGVNTVTYTDTTPSVAELYPKLSDGIQRISTSRFLPPTKIFMHPRRWGWIAAALDGQSRPLMVPAEQGPQNAVAAPGEVVAEGYVGRMHGLPVFVDANLPSTNGTGTNEDVIVIARTDDLRLWESTPVAIVDRWSLAANLSVRLVLREYLAVQHGRFPTAVSILAGSGLAEPTF